MRPKRTQRRSHYQNLESRKLLAADIGMPFSSYELMDFQDGGIVEVQEFAFDQMNFDQMMGDMANSQMEPLLADRLPNEFFSVFEMPSSFTEYGDGVEAANWNFGSEDLQGGSVGDVLREPMIVESMDMFEFDGWDAAEYFVVEMDDFGFEVFQDLFNDSDFDSEFVGSPGEATDPVIFEEGFLDVSDGADGVFGSLDSENPDATYAFVAPEDGQATVVLSTNVASGGLNVELTDASGNTVEPNSADSDSGFAKWSFDIKQGEVYSLTVSGEDGDVGDYQLTVSVEAAEPVDTHSDDVGENATVLEFNDGLAEAFSNIETDGDRDVFQFVAPTSGEVVLEANDVSLHSDLNLSVTVYDSEGQEVVSGSTNASVALEFDVTEGETWFVSVGGAEGQTGSYYFAVVNEEFFPVPEDSDDPTVDVEDLDESDIDNIVDESEPDSADLDDGIAVEEGEVDSDVVVIDIDVEDLDEIEVESELSTDEGAAAGEVVQDLNDVEVMDETLITAEDRDETEIESLSFDDWFFAFDAAAQPSESFAAETSSEQDSRRLASVPNEIRQPSLVGEPAANVTDDGEIQLMEVVEIDLSELDELDLDTLFSTNWFEGELSWI